MTKQQKWKKQLIAEINALREGNEGRLNPATLISWAKEHPNSALHGSFEWDESRAAHEYRLSQARHMITVYAVEYIENPVKKRSGYLSVPVLRSKKGVTALNGSYLPERVVKTHESYRLSVLEEVTKNLQTMRNKYAELLPELNDVWKSIPD